MRNLLALALAGAATLAVAQPAAAFDRRIILINNTSATVVEVYGSNRDRDTWEEDVLGANVIPPGSYATIDFNDGSGYCIFDLMAVMENGEQMIQRGANVCTVDSWTIHE